MLFYLILLFTIIPVLELYFLIKIGSYIGAFNTIAIVIITGVAGAVLAKREGLKILRQIQDEMNQLKMPADTLLDGFFVLVGGVMLLTPGFLTDVTGFLLVIPFTRYFFRQLLKKKIKANIDRQDTIIIDHF